MREYKEPFKAYCDHLDECGQHGDTHRCLTCGAAWLKPTYCYNKICPSSECKEKRHRRAFVRLRDFVKPPKSRTLKLITLTYSPKGSIKDAKQQIRTAWKSVLRHLKSNAHPVHYWTGVYEIVAKKGGLFYVHLHVIADVEYIPQKKLSELWVKRTGHAIVDIRALNSKGAISYLAKYLGKGIKQEVSLSFFPMLHYSFSELRRLRLYTTSLDYKGISGTSELDELNVPRCPFCSSAEIMCDRQIGNDVFKYLERPKEPLKASML